jgi:hypothetical protein
MLHAYGLDGKCAMTSVLAELTGAICRACGEEYISLSPAGRSCAPKAVRDHLINAIGMVQHLQSAEKSSVTDVARPWLIYADCQVINLDQILKMQVNGLILLRSYLIAASG